VRAHDAKRDLALCVASDGLWDFVEEKDGAEFTQTLVKLVTLGDFFLKFLGVLL
jgi:serine/threonine protein phosphatase PrpC